MIDLTDADIDLLMHGLDAIEKGAAQSDAMATLLGGLMARGDDRLLSLIEAEREKQMVSKREARRIKREDSAILKAKLIAFRRERNRQDFGVEIENKKPPP